MSKRWSLVNGITCQKRTLEPSSELVSALYVKHFSTVTRWGSFVDIVFVVYLLSPNCVPGRTRVKPNIQNVRACKQMCPYGYFLLDFLSCADNGKNHINH